MIKTVQTESEIRVTSLTLTDNDNGATLTWMAALRYTCCCGSVQLPSSTLWAVVVVVVIVYRYLTPHTAVTYARLQ
jgi:hypothetical protein